jgi:hypothetical protein
MSHLLTLQTLNVPDTLFIRLEMPIPQISLGKPPGFATNGDNYDSIPTGEFHE